MTWDFTVAHLQGVSPAEAVELMGEYEPTGQTSTVELANLDGNILVRQYGDWCAVVGSTPIL